MTTTAAARSRLAPIAPLPRPARFPPRVAGAVAERGVVTSRADGTVASPAHDSPAVRARDTLRVVAPYDSTTCFIRVDRH